MQLFHRHVSGRGLTLFGCEVLLIAGSIAVAARVHGVSADLPAQIWKVALVTGVWQLCFYYNDLYDLRIVHSSRELLIRLAQAAGAAAILIALLHLAAPSLALSRGILVSALGIFVLAIAAWRFAFNRVTASPALGERVLLVGSGATARLVAREIERQHDFGYRLVGYVDDDATPASRALGPTRDLTRVVREHGIDRIVVGVSDRRGHLPIAPLLEAKFSGIYVEDATTMYERLTGKILIDDLKPSWLIFSDGCVVSRRTRWVKRAADLLFATCGMALSAPLMLLTAIAVYVDSGAPVLYGQARVGENGAPLTVWKFRSMRTDAEQEGVPLWATDADVRVTRVGRVIRTTRLDELPQFWNVLRGDMSFVGPRPERPYFVEQLARDIPFYQQRHAVKPGLTGWAQVKFHYGSSVEDATEKLRYDLYYIKHLSIGLDVSIVLDTVKVILFGTGAK